MRVLLLRTYPENSVCSSIPPLGLGYLATALDRAGIDAEIFDLGNIKRKKSELAEILKQRPPDLIGLQVYSREVPTNIGLLEFVRAHLPSMPPIVVGGPHPSTMHEEIFDHMPGIDYALAGEGEESLPMLARYVGGDRSVALDQIPGLAWKDNGNLRRNSVRFSENIDGFDFPDWDKMRLDGYRTEVFGGGFTKRVPAMTMLTSRGCPFRCAFCCSSTIYGNRLRLRNPECVIEEMHILRDRLGFREIKIIDDNFNADRRHVFAVAEAFRRRPVDVSLSFACGLYLNTLDDETLRAVRDMGGYELMIAVESGSQRILDLMNKPVDLETVEEKVNMIRRHGFNAVSFFIIGYPGETREDIERTIRLSLRLPIARAHFNCFSPPPGSPVYEELQRKGLIKDFDIRHIHFETINYSFVEGLSVRQLNRLRIKALLRFYLRPKIFLGMLKTFNNWSGVRFLFAKGQEYLSFR